MARTHTAHVTAATIALTLAASPPAGADGARPPPPPAVTAPPTDTTPPAKPPARFYGVVRPAMVVANGLESFGFANLAAPTAAANPVVNPAPDQLGASYQIMQTRFGVVVGEGWPARATIEVDFVHLDQSSPTTAAYPRVRQAFAEWQPADGHRVLVGQTWDLFAPLNTHSFDLIANLFQAGNAGYIRQEAVYLRATERAEYGVAVGLPGTNNGSSLSAVEYNLVPTVAVRAAVRRAGVGQLGAAAIASSVRFDGMAGADDSYRAAYGASAFGEHTGRALELRGEAFAGVNLANLGVIALGQGSADASVVEAGGWLSARLALSPSHAAHAIAGAGAVLTPGRLQLGYAPAVADGKPQRLAGNGPGIERNLVGRLGYTVSPGAGISFMAEPFVMFTRHKLAAADRATGVEPDRVGYGVQVGGQYRF
jgi:hypothetical protein